MSYGRLAQLKVRLEQDNEFERQMILLQGNPTGGSFVLGYAGVDTDELNYDASAAEMQAALVTATGLDPNDIKVSGGNGLDWAVLFEPNKATGPIYLTTSSLTGGSSPTVKTNTLMQECLDAGAATLDSEIGHAWGTAPATPAAQTVYGDGTDTLLLPPYAGAVASVADPNGNAVTTYTEQGGALRFTRSGYLAGPSSSRNYWGGWSYGYPYVVTARFGWGDAPADVVESNLQLAARLYVAGQGRYSDVVGVAGNGEVLVSGAYPKYVNECIKRRYDEAHPLVIV
jgi:hypothetical protein